MANREGLKSALKITEDELVELLDIGRDQQMSLLPLNDFDMDTGETTAPQKRGRGRPKGALNKSTAWWRDYIVGRFGSPLEALAQIYSRPLAVLVAELQCTPVEAIRLQLEAASRLAPYVHQKLPVQVDLGDRGLVNLTIVMNAANERLAGAQGAGGFTIDVEPVRVEDQNATKSEA